VSAVPAVVPVVEVDALFRDGLDPVTAESWAEEDACGGSASVHLSFDHLEPVEIAFDDAGAWPQVGLVVGDGGELVVEAVAVQAGEDLGELGDVAGVRVQVRAVLPGPGEFVLSSSSRLSGSVRIQLARSRARRSGDGGGAARASPKDGTWLLVVPYPSCRAARAVALVAGGS